MIFFRFIALVGAAFVGLAFSTIVCVGIGVIESPLLGGKALWMPAYSIGSILIGDSLIFIISLLVNKAKSNAIDLPSEKFMAIGLLQGIIFIPIFFIAMPIWRFTLSLHQFSFFISIFILAFISGVATFLVANMAYFFGIKFFSAKKHGAP